MDDFPNLQGPITITLLVHPETNKQIYLLGDHHYIDPHPCSKSLKIQDAIETLVDENQDKTIDIFVEYPIRGLPRGFHYTDDRNNSFFVSRQLLEKIRNYGEDIQREMVKLKIRRQLEHTDVFFHEQMNDYIEWQIANVHYMIEDVIDRLEPYVDMYYEKGENDKWRTLSMIYDGGDYPIDHFTIMLSSSLMDMYTMARLFRTFDDDDPIQYVILYCGTAHTELYRRMLITFFGFEEITHIECPNQCCKVVRLQFFD